MPATSVSAESSCVSLLLADLEHNFGQSGGEGAGNPEKQRPFRTRRPESHWLWLYLADFLWSYLFISSFVIAYWRGLWDYVCHLEEVVGQVDVSWLMGGEAATLKVCYISNPLCLMVALPTAFILQVFQEQIQSQLTAPPSSSARANLIARLFSLVLGAADIWYWKAVWDGINCVFGYHNELVSWLTLLIGFIVLVAAGRARTLVSVPNGLAMDLEDNRCSTSLYWEQKPCQSLLSRSWNVAVTLFLQAFNILFWHGYWTLKDLYLMQSYGMSQRDSAWLGAAAGLGLGFFTLLIQFPVARLMQSKSIRPTVKFVCDALYCFLNGVATVSWFRSVWYLLDSYYLTDNYPASLITGALFGLLFLFVFNCGNSLNPGFSEEATEERSPLIGTYYFTYHSFMQELELNKTRSEEKGTEMNGISV